jgi:hypothetical protein
MGEGVEEGEVLKEREVLEEGDDGMVGLAVFGSEGGASFGMNGYGVVNC